MQLDFEKGVTVWDGIAVPMRDFRAEGKSNEYNLIYTDIPESQAVKEMAERTNKILDAKYEKANLKQVIKKLNYLTKVEQKGLLKLLQKYETMFDGTLGLTKVLSIK